MKIISFHISGAAYLLAALLFIPVKSVKSQTNALTPEMLLPRFSKISPEAASLGKFGAYNVSEYSGSPDIRIPLFTIQSGDVSIPVELYYDASGIKVEQDATFVGLGWNLSYGGCISRTICGGDDFLTNPITTDSYFKNRYANHPTYIPLFCYPYSTNKTICTATPVLTMCEPLDLEEYNLHDELSRGYYAPDVFQASFCGQHVSFVIENANSYSSKIIILNNDPRKYKIEYERKGIYPNVFRITDDKGITYQFQAFGEFDVADSYYLTGVYGPDGASGKSAITYEYKEDRIQLGTSRTIIKNIFSMGKYLEGWYDSETADQLYDYILPHVHFADLACGNHGFCSKIYPSKITTATEIIEFKRQERKDIVGAYAINGIQVKSISDSILDKISFSYGYFEEENSTSNISGYTRKRLKLDAVTVNSKKYKMTYDTTTLPTFESKSQDYWGYYNGANNHTLCGTPKYVVENNTTKLVEYLGDANRYASENHCKVGMLKRIIYPTGGYSEFEFESNRFEDEYYYPDAASQNKTFVNTTINLVGGQGPRSQSKSFSFQEETKCNFSVILFTTPSTKDVSTAILKNATTGVIVKRFSVSDGEQLTQDCSLTLAKGDYIMEANITANTNGYSTIAYCGLSYEDITIPVPNISLGETKGGISMGGGLRIKSIKNYDSSSEFKNGIVYEYRGGKLLKPTVRLQTRHIDFSFYSDMNTRDNSPQPDDWFIPDSLRIYLQETPPIFELFSPEFSFSYANSEPSYLSVCSLDVPATVGYSTVIKKEVDEEGAVIRRRELEFHNNGYNIDDPINQIMDYTVYCCYNGHLNGKLKKETIYSENNKVQYMADYSYEDTIISSVLYPVCIPAFFPKDRLCTLNYNTALFQKASYWCYLTRKNESYYDINGNKTTSKTTSFAYDSSNYQPSEQTVSDGTNSQKVKYWYPSTSGNKSAGLSYLTNKNCLSEVTGIDQYRNNKFTGGSRYDYTTKSSLPNNLPVVSKCHSILPDNSKVLQMTVTDNDSCGNIREYKLKDGTPVTIIWSYNHQHPIMEIVGSTYANVKAKVSAVASLESSSSISYSTLMSVYTSLKTGLPDAHVTAYLYSPWHSVSRIIAPNGYETTYNYDNEGRLVEARDPQGILQKYQYNYKIK
ncbi:MAG: RHS repeat protein [Prevotella sp.]|nr:RHS repeat protein [Prevotella sp.]